MQIKLHNEQQCNVVTTNGSVDSDLPPDTAGYIDGEGTPANLTALRFGMTFMNLTVNSEKASKGLVKL